MEGIVLKKATMPLSLPVDRFSLDLNSLGSHLAFLTQIPCNTFFFKIPVSEEKLTSF